jgi:Tfp pilus assembly protein PilZ
MPHNSESDRPAGDGAERRTETRRLTCIPVELERQDEPDLALIRNVSLGGALLYTRTECQIGDELRLHVHFTGADDGVPVDGTVVRVRPREHGRRDLWRFEIGVQFEAPLEAYQEQIRELAERQERMGLFKYSSKPPAP